MPKAIRSNFTFGALMAEGDPLLSAAYLDNGDFESVASFDDPRRFIIGRTGSGKSALFQHLEECYPHKVVRIVPENLSLPYITNLDVIRQLLTMGVHLEPFLKALWKHVIVVEILRHRYQIISPEIKRNILSMLIERLKRDPAKVKAIEYLNEFGDKFWCEADERVKQIAESFQKKIKSSGEVGASAGGVGLKGGGDVEQTASQEIHRETVAKYQRIVNETQLPRLNQMINIVHNEILESPQHRTYLIIDDLDKEWVDETLSNLLIRCLFQAVIDMQPVKHLKIVVALRTNIFQQLNFGEQSQGGQEEKFRGLRLFIRWTKNDLRSLLEQRAEAACQRYQIEPSKTLSELLPPADPTYGDSLSYILSRTLMRPRDAILYLNECVREATGTDAISWDNIFHAEKQYSEERLLALRDEWKDPYLDIDKVFECFRRRPWRLSRTELTQILEDIALLLESQKFRGPQWLTPLCEQVWAPGSKQKTWEELYGPLVNLLCNLSFLGVAPAADKQAIYSYMNPNQVQQSVEMKETTLFEVHPAFRQGLEMQEKPYVNVA
ncbi:MAG TPA: hypothetical protein VKT82_12090 [Ktedonobacterales bacterium]|nr:hypothetical protein [Ktedonobacterales bacterium]